MLSEEQRKQIRAEEIWREELRQSLQSRPTTATRLWTLANSSFGIFVMSSICLSGFAVGYSSCQERQRLQQSTEERVRRLDAEIAYRISLLRAVDKDEYTFTEVHTARAAISGEEEDDPEAGRLDEFTPVFPEFKARTLVALLWELQASVDPEKSSEVRKAIEAAKLAVSTRILEQRDRTRAPADDQESMWRFQSGVRDRYEKQVLAPFDLARWKF